MDRFEVVFRKVLEIREDDEARGVVVVRDEPDELEEIEELRRFSAELAEQEPPSFTTT